MPKFKHLKLVTTWYWDPSWVTSKRSTGQFYQHQSHALLLCSGWLEAGKVRSITILLIWQDAIYLRPVGKSSIENFTKDDNTLESNTSVIGRVSGVRCSYLVSRLGELIPRAPFQNNMRIMYATVGPEQGDLGGNLDSYPTCCGYFILTLRNHLSHAVWQANIM